MSKNNGYDSEETDKDLNTQHSPNIQKTYDKDDLKHGKSDEEIELDDIDADNEKMEEKEENEEAHA